MAIRVIFLPFFTLLVLLEAFLEWVEDNSYSWYWSVKSLKLKFRKWVNEKLPV